MGNYMSCNGISPSSMKNKKAARVILPGGEVRQFREPIKVAEIMLECPNYFLVNSNGLNTGRRFSPLSADEDLEFGNLYILFPMRRVNSFVMAADLAVVLMAASTAAKRISGGGNGRISPVVGVEVEAEAEVEAEEEASASSSSRGVTWNVESARELEVEDMDIFPGGEYRYRLSVCRSRKPMLDTIFEEPVLAR